MLAYIGADGVDGSDARVVVKVARRVVLAYSWYFTTEESTGSVTGSQTSVLMRRGDSYGTGLVEMCELLRETVTCRSVGGGVWPDRRSRSYRTIVLAKAAHA